MMNIWRKRFGNAAAARVMAIQMRATPSDMRACTVLLARRGMAAGEGKTTGRRSHTDEMGTGGLIKDTRVKGAPPGTSQGVEDLPPGNPVEKLATGVTGGIKKAVETVKEVIDRDRDQSVEIGDQASDNLHVFQKVVKVEAQKAREHLNRDAGPWTGGTGAPGGIDMPPHDPSASSEPVTDSTARVTKLESVAAATGKVLNKAKEVIGKGFEAVKSRAAGPMEELKHKLEETEDRMQEQAAEERRRLTMKMRHEREAHKKDKEQKQERESKSGAEDQPWSQ